MDTKDLRSFMRVYEEKSINKAAKQLFITPQGLSRVIHNLETDLGTSLFERTPGGMIPTESGTYLYENCHTLLRELNALETGIRRYRNRDSRIEIGFSGYRTCDRADYRERLVGEGAAQHQFICAGL